MTPGFQTLRLRLLAFANGLAPSHLSRKFGDSDLVQEALTEITRDFASFRGQSEAELMAWAFTILRRTALDHVSRFRADKRNANREQSLTEWIPSRQSKPDEQAEFNEQIALRLAALSRLPDKQRWIIEQRDLFAREYPELAVESGMSEIALRKLYSRAIVAWKAEADCREAP